MRSTTMTDVEGGLFDNEEKKPARIREQDRNGSSSIGSHASKEDNKS
jgi:hypothetical protein